MSQSDTEIEWFLGRDGKQYGPITDREMQKLVELGHLRPGDLVWKQGLADWMPAHKLFPPKAAPAPPPPAPASKDPSLSARTSQQAPAQTSPGAPGRQATGSSPGRPDGSEPAMPSAPFVNPPPPGMPKGSSTAPSRQSPYGTPGSAPYANTEAQRTQPTWAKPMAPPPPPVAGASPHWTPPPAPRPGAPQKPASRQSHGAHASNLSLPAPPPPPNSTLSQSPIPVPDRLDRIAGGEQPRRRFPWLLAAAVLVLSIAGGGGLALYMKGMVPQLSMPFVNSSGSPGKPSAAIKQSPLQGFAASAAEVDAGFQKAALWQLIKREFPEWYQQRVEETAKLHSEKKGDKEISLHLTQALVDLRRKNASAALAAGPERLRYVAASFVENLTGLAKHSTDACFNFISQGETSPVVVDLMRSSQFTPGLQTQFTAIFEAIAEGRKSPRTHEPPKREDYDVLAAQLATRGWSPMDLQTFSDARALAKATPERVCKMVQDWFAAQLAVKDNAMQIRLLVEALKPVVAG